MDQNRPGSDPRYEDEIHLRDIWNLLLRNWFLIAFILFAVVGAAAWYTFTAIPVYESTATVRIDEESSNVPVLDILQTLSSGSQVETEMEVIRSRTLAKEVVSGLDLQVSVVRPRGVARAVVLGSLHVTEWAEPAVYLLEQDPVGNGYIVRDQETMERVGSVSVTEPAILPGLTFTLQPAALDYAEIVLEVFLFDEAVEAIRETVSVARPNREAGIVNIRYESADTQLVHMVPNRLAREFILDRQEVRKTEARSTVDFLEEQLDTLRIQLSAAEEALQTFKEEGQIVSLAAEASAQVTQLAALQAERNQINAERQALQELVDEIEAEAAAADPTAASPYRRMISFPSLFTNQAISELLRSLNTLDQQRGALLERRTAQDPEVQNLTQRIRDLEQQLRSITTTYLQGLNNQVSSYDETLSRFSRELEQIPGEEVQVMRLEREQQVLEEIYTLLQTRLQEARIAQAVEDPSVRVVDAAVLPVEPIKPRKALNLALALVLGGMLGVGLAFTREYMDDTIHTREDIQSASGGVPVLGLIPRIRGAGFTNGRRKVSKKERRGEATGVEALEGRLVTGKDPRNPVSEAYRSLRTNITFANPDQPPKILVFTSPLPRDGKSTTAANLAITLSQQGSSVLLVDGDLRRGVLNTVFGLPREPGLSELLVGTNGFAETLQTVDLGESGTMDFLSTGTLPPNPAELLGSQRMVDLMAHMSNIYDLVIVDAPPLTVVTDAAVVGTKADGVVMVSRASYTEKGAITYSMEQLRNVRANVIGTVLNDVDYRRDGRYNTSYGKYGYYYQFYYGDDGKRKKEKDAAKKKARKK